MFDVFSIFYVALNERHHPFFVSIAPRVITPGQVPASGRNRQPGDKPSLSYHYLACYLNLCLGEIFSRFH